MKTICMLLLLATQATDMVAQKNKITDSVDVTIRLHKRFNRHAPIDSVYIFFDRYNRTGAGIVKQVYYPKDNQIVISRVPPGKYYIGLYCMGAHQQFFSEITFVNNRRSNRLRFNLARSETYVPGTFIPPGMDLSKLAITRPQSFKQ